MIIKLKNQTPFNTPNQKNNQNLPLMHPIEKDEKDNLLSENSIQSQLQSGGQSIESKPSTQQTLAKQADDIIDPIQQLVKNNNVIPLLAVIDQVDLCRKVQDKPLISILAQKFIPLHQLLKGRDISFPLDDDGRSPLHYAIEADDVKAAAWLIEKGHHNQRDNFGQTPIVDAIRLGRQRIFLLCLKNKLYDQRAPLHAAVYNRHWQLKVLHGMGINIFAYRDEQNKSAFQRALQYCSFDCAQFMIKIRPDIDVDKFLNFTESKGIIRKIKKIQLSLSAGERMKQLFRPLLILLLLYLGISSSILGLDGLYQNSGPFYVIISLLILFLHALTYIFGKFFNSKVQYTQKHSLSQILGQPHYNTLQQMCPMCVHLTHYRYDHCYVCGYCVDKFHFHSFVCINRANQVFWVMGEFVWMYFAWAVLGEFNQFIEWMEVSVAGVSGWKSIKLIATMEHLFVEHKFLAIIWLIFLVLFYLYQLFYCLALFGMMCMRRKFQEVIYSQKYLHLYRVVKVDDNYMNKEKKIFERGLFGGFQRCLRNFFVYFFTIE